MTGAAKEHWSTLQSHAARGKMDFTAIKLRHESSPLFYHQYPSNHSNHSVKCRPLIKCTVLLRDTSGALERRRARVGVKSILALRARGVCLLTREVKM